MRRYVRLTAAVAMTAGAITITVAGGIANAASGGGRHVAANVRAPAGAQGRVYSPPLLVPDPVAYARAKAAANAAAHESVAVTPQTLLAPVLLHSWQGFNDTAHAPSDSTSAAGLTRYIAMMNSDYAIYNKSTGVLDNGPLINITGCVTSLCADSIFDPQIIWDSATNRFFYAVDDVIDSTHHYLVFGFSTTASPSGLLDWCSYNLAFGASFPDYPKLGDTRDFLLIGSNIFNGSSYAGSDVTWVTKPGAGSTCPAGSTFRVGTQTALKNADGTPAFTPVPANQIDGSSTGWVVARPATLPSNGGTFLSIFKVTKSTTGSAIVQATGTKVTVPAYKVPAAAPQQGSTNQLDTSDTRNTQAVSAIDPAHANSVALWTQHTVFGGAGAEVRWYEINPTTSTLFQSGKVTSASVFTFNAAISPDRAVSGRVTNFGSNMVLDANTSSTTTPSRLELVSKIGSAAQSTPLVVANSAGPDIGFDCVAKHGLCRWGDYASATPDPSVTTGTKGVVWGSTMLSFKSSDTTSANWATWNFAASP